MSTQGESKESGYAAETARGKSVTSPISEYMRGIGAKGGRSGKGITKTRTVEQYRAMGKKSAEKRVSVRTKEEV